MASLGRVPAATLRNEVFEFLDAASKTQIFAASSRVLGEDSVAAAHEMARFYEDLRDALWPLEYAMAVQLGLGAEAPLLFHFQKRGDSFDLRDEVDFWGLPAGELAYEGNLNVWLRRHHGYQSLSPLQAWCALNSHKPDVVKAASMLGKCNVRFRWYPALHLPTTPYRISTVILITFENRGIMGSCFAIDPDPILDVDLINTMLDELEAIAEE